MLINIYINRKMKLNIIYGGAFLFLSILSPIPVFSTAIASEVNQNRKDIQAEVVYVYAFDANSDQVQLDRREERHLETPDAESNEQQQTALEARTRLADQLVHRLQSMGIPATRIDGPAPQDRNSLIVKGHFDDIDAGDRRRRALVGLGAGKSEVRASVSVLYQPVLGAPLSLADFDTEADSGHMPGIAESAGIGAVTGRLATSLAVSGGTHEIAEATHDTVSSDVDRLAESIAKQLSKKATEQGWLRIPKAG
jgi:hypothetical protein